MKQLLVILVCILLTGCGARKRTLSKSERVEVTKSDVKMDSAFGGLKVVKILKEDTEIDLEPIDTANPIIINRDTIYNTKIKYRTIRKDSIIYERDTVYVEKIDKSLKSVEESKKNVQAEREAFNWTGLIWFLLIISTIWILRKRL
ncbi:MAG: hypothetical protein AAF039_15090 [Bacteroidota bacterium]